MWTVVQLACYSHMIYYQKNLSELILKLLPSQCSQSQYFQSI